MICWSGHSANRPLKRIEYPLAQPRSFSLSQEPNRPSSFRDVLLVKGYEVTYKEFDSGHDYIWRRGSLADGLIPLIGRKGG
jgi:hypothetical protein